MSAEALRARDESILARASPEAGRAVGRAEVFTRVRAEGRDAIALCAN